MTFDDIKEMQIGSKTVKEAWLNGKQVYPSKRRIIDSLVCWYDIGKQQCTNESMASNPVLADLSGNGHDITCYNFAWSGMSGVGGYLFNKPVEKWYAPVKNNGVYEQVGNTLHITTLSTANGTYYVTNSSALLDQLIVTVDDTGTAVTKPFKIRISGLPENKQVRISGLLGSSIDGETHNVGLPNQLFGNGEHTVQSVTAQNTYTITQINFPSIYIDSDTADEVDITIEFLPEYPNALVSDGVDDYTETIQVFPKDKGTVIAVMQQLEGNISTALLMPSDKEGISNIWYSGLFIGGNNLPGIGFYGTGNRIMVNYSGDEIYLKNTSIFIWNNSIPEITINLNNRESKGDSIEHGHTKYNFFRDNDANYYAKAALYSFLLFDRTLTTAEIEWVRQNMIQSERVLKTDWEQLPWTDLNISRVTGTESSNVIKITACTQAQNFKETGLNSYVPSFKIKVTGLKNGIILRYVNPATQKYEDMEEDGIYTLEEQEGYYIGFRFNKTFENESIVIQQLLS